MPPIADNQNINTMVKNKSEIKNSISQNFIVQLYKQNNQPVTKQPNLQILGFEESNSGMLSQITIRLSDTVVFIDCSLVGPYTIENDNIVCRQNRKVIQYHRFDIVQISDYFHKIDTSRICKLRMIIRKIMPLEKCSLRQGYPQEAGQFMHNNYDLNYGLKNVSKERSKSQDIQKIIKTTPNIEIQIKKTNKKQDSLIKIQDDPQNPIESYIKIEADEEEENYKRQEMPLKLAQIMQGKHGFFIGRLIRMKLGARQTKEGQMTVLALGFINKQRQVLRINILGRLALKEARELKKGKCYHVQGFDLYKNEKMQNPQLRYKQKEGKITEMPIQTRCNDYPYEHFSWEHQNSNKIQVESVDVIGVIDEIEQLTSYPQSNSNQIREVIRIVVRNTIKSVRISFWAQQMQALKLLKLRKKEAVIFQDIKKKKNMFLDFTVESTFIRLDDDLALKEKLSPFLPQCQLQDEPTNLKQLDAFYDNYPNNNKIRNFTFFLSRLQENKIFYKTCASCTRKAQKLSAKCGHCQLEQFKYKYNCQAEITDFSGTASCMLFDLFAKKVFDKTATELSEMNQQQLQEVIDGCLFKEYIIGIEYKNLRLIVRDISEVAPEIQAQKNVREIKKRLGLVEQFLEKA